MRIATRGSPMAVAQTEEVIRQLAAKRPDIAVEKILFKTRGDADNTSRLTTIGGKGGAFVGQLRDEIRAGRFDAAMHSLKDIPGNEETPGLVLGAYLRRDSVADCLVLREGVSEADLRLSTKRAPLKIGTSSARRRAFLSMLYPGCEVIHFRGAVIGSEQSRLHKLDHRLPQRVANGPSVGPADALVLAASGLMRLGQGHRIAREYSFDEMLPAVGQGIVAVECRSDDFRLLEALASIDDYESRQCALAERELLWVLDGHCDSPIAGVCVVKSGGLELRAAVMGAGDGTFLTAQAAGRLDSPRTLGRTVALDLLARGARDVIESTRPSNQEQLP